MVESSEHRDCVNASLGLRGTWNGLLVRESLVRACVVVETHVLGDDACGLHPDEMSLECLELGLECDVLPIAEPYLPAAASRSRRCSRSGSAFVRSCVSQLFCDRP